MTDETAAIRAEMVQEMPENLRAVIEAGEPVWTTAQMQEEFEALAFMAPFIVVRRKSDGAKGSLMFAHSPRYYFNFQED